MEYENILITDYHCASNRGDAAILEGEIAVFENVFPESEITVMTEYPEAAELLHEIDIVPQHITPLQISNPLKNSAIVYALLNASLQQTIKKSLPLSEFVCEKLSLEPYYNSDVVISTGGQFITGVYYPEKIAVLLEWYLAKLVGKPLIIYAQSLGPFPIPYRALTRTALNYADLIITRDKQSQTHLNDLGVTTPTHIGVDAAWTMPLNDEPRPLQRKWRANASISENEEGPIISISARQWSHFETESGEKEYQQAIAEAAMELIDIKDAKIVFLSTCTGLGGYHTDDRVAATYIMDMMDDIYQEDVEIISEELTPQQLVSLYSDIDLHVGTRMHSCILSLMAGTPCVPIEYQFKTSGMMSQFNLTEYVLSIDDLDDEELLDKIIDVINNKKAIKNQINNNLSEIQEIAYKDAEIVREYLSKV